MLLGIAGPARSGKTTVGDIIAGEFKGHTTYALASPIKNTINSLFGWDERHSDGVLKEEVCYTRAFHCGEIWTNLYKLLKRDVEAEYVRSFYSIFDAYCVFDSGGFMQYKISPRKAYQLFGTEWGRQSVCDTIWLDMAPKENCILTDVRFNNEAEYLKNLNGKIIAIESNRNTTQENKHSSESGVDISYVSATIRNDKGQSIDELKWKVTKLCRILK